MAVLTPALSHTLAQASRRVRLLWAIGGGATGLLAGAVISLGLLLLLRTRFLEDIPAEILALPPLVGLLAGALWRGTRRVSPLDVARLTEQRLDLKERLSTAVTLAPTADNPLAARQIADAEFHAARGLDLQAALPLRLPRIAWIALGAVLLVFSAWFLPTLSVFQSPRERAERAAVKREGERIIRIAKVLEHEAATRKLDQTRQAANRLGALGRQMQRGRLSKQKALMKIAKLNEQIKQSQQALAAANAPKSLPAAGNELQKALQAAQALPKNGGVRTPGLNPEGDPKRAQGAKAAPAQQAMSQARKALGNADMPSLAEQLSRLAQQAAQGQPGDKAGQEKLAQQLEALAKALKGTRLEKASADLRDAAEAMKQGDMPAAARQLQAAARKVGEAAKRGEDAAAMQQMAQALANGQTAEASEGDMPSDQGEGEGDKDAFGNDGKPKEHRHDPGGT